MKAVSKHGIQAPQLPRHLPVSTLASISDQVDISAVSLTNLNLENQVAAGVTFEQVRCRHVNCIRARIQRLRILDARLENCDLSAVDWEKAHMRRVEFHGCRIWGAILLQADFADVQFQECNAENAVFAQARFHATRFEDCNLARASFADTDLSGVVFARCDLSQADLRGAKMQDSDLRGSILEGVQVNAQDLHGVVIEPAQAVAVARALGIDVQDRVV